MLIKYLARIDPKFKQLCRYVRMGLYCKSMRELLKGKKKKSRTCSEFISFFIHAFFLNKALILVSVEVNLELIQDYDSEIDSGWDASLLQGSVHTFITYSVLRGGMKPLYPRGNPWRAQD